MRAPVIAPDNSVGVDSASSVLVQASIIKLSQNAQDAAAAASKLVATAAQSSTLATVATTGSYNDLTNKPAIPAAQVQSDWAQSNTGSIDYIKNKPVLSGATAARPVSPAVGTMFFDTTLGKPIWFVSPGWVDATGTAA